MTPSFVRVVVARVVQAIQKLKDYYTGESVGECIRRARREREFGKYEDFIPMKYLCDLTDAKTIEDFRRKSEYYEKMVNGK